MVHRFLIRRRSGRGLIGAGLALAVSLLVLLPAGSEEFLKKSYVVPGDPKPINLSADAISTWKDGGQRVFLLRGNVWIEQGLIKLSMPESVVWVDEGGKKNTGIYQVQVYGEGGVVVKEMAQQATVNRVLLDFATRGDVTIKARVNKVLQEPMTRDLVFMRAKAEKDAALQSSQAPRSAGDPAVQPISQTVSQSMSGAPASSSTTPSASAPPAYSSGTPPAVPVPPPPGAPWLPPSSLPPALPDQVSSQSAKPAMPPDSKPIAEPPPVPSGPIQKMSWQTEGPPTPQANGPPGANAPPGQALLPTNEKPNALPNLSEASALPGADKKPLLEDSAAATPQSPGVIPVIFGPDATTAAQGNSSANPSTSTPVVPAQVVPAAPPGANPPSPPSPGSAPLLPPGPQMPPTPDFQAPGPLRQLNITPRSNQPIQFKSIVLSSGETAWVVTSGVILTVSNPTASLGIVDIEADRLVFWTKGNSQQMFDNMRGTGETKSSKSMEFYLSGNVEIRNKTKKETQTLRADEVYYDVGRNVAIALRAELEILQPRLPYPFHVKSDEIRQLNAKQFESVRSVVFATSLPSDPGLEFIVSKASIEETDTPRRNIFGFQIKDQKTGEPLTAPQRIFRGSNMVVRLEGLPVFYFPYIQGDPDDPLGPLDDLNVNYSQIFGFQLLTTWNIYDLVGMTPVPGTHWRLDLDYMSLRGPALGSSYDFSGRDMFFGLPGRYEGLVKAYGIYDQGTDIIGGGRGTTVFTTPTTILPITHPNMRGRFLSRLNVQDLPNGFTFQGQVSALSDKNFLEQYYNGEFNNDINQQTFAYLKQQQGNWAYTILAEQRIRNWVTETSWLPKVDGYLLGQKIFDLFTYNGKADMGFGRLTPTHQPPPAYLPTDVNVNTGRFDLMQELSLPFSLGAFRLVPYVVGDLAYYTENINKNDQGRLLGGAGLRGSLPLSRLYSTVASDLFNLNGLYHKILISANYYNAFSSVSMQNLPQLDRLNDDTTDQALRDIFPRQSALNPVNAPFLTTSNEFNPQFYALRRLLDNHIDTLDNIEVIQTDIRQRWQTQRGFPGNQHVIDWMTLDVGASIFPRSNRDNFGQTFGILRYDWTWNIGDMTSVVSEGWMDPISGGPRVFNIGAYVSRPDRTSLYLGYRQIDPLLSKAVVANISYAFSAKYAISGSTMYDFGVNTQVNSISITRIGTDLQVSLGLSLNTILNNVGVTFSVMPNLMPTSSRGPLGVGTTGTTGGPMGVGR